ncbi:uncharacterized protein BO97DRAFT_463928 [Aspergillus homomorphus CBS 101889]|uniref:Uncharacterized protein n=1 Tax=Aspergillus homomorphus (strain CBS 101889) TaxID=1450537 RepID=A0A395HM67_ASPHC|nr:hypothetical protein BO97DRAFT_463928 [Aspergillus homomorphus CBS 101889]RAL07364.1 hypothetical protein BO97DRAFT_463928 [Aspergillus homomorphus CBS 101889]
MISANAGSVAHCLISPQISTQAFSGLKPPDTTETTMTFTGKFNLEDPASPGSRDWADKLLTPKGGFLWVQHNETLEVTWAVSMYHGLHCIETIRSRMLETAPGPRLYQSQNAELSDHAAHCLDYLAQSLVCSGDTTIEPPFWRRDENGNIVGYGVDGEGTQHHCKDTRRVRDLIESSERDPVSPWGWKLGDTVESVFGL